MNDRHAAEPILRRLAPVSRILNRVALVVLREDVGGQGRHVDPDAPGTPPPNTARWTAAHSAAVTSPTMKVFRDALRPVSGGTERQGVLDDLAHHFGMSTEEALARCLDWESASLEEWEAAPRDNAAQIREFYDSATSWAFDLSWYNYLQVDGTGYPKSVIVADRLELRPGARVLDYGSGVGVTAQLFAGLPCAGRSLEPASARPTSSTDTPGSIAPVRPRESTAGSIEPHPGLRWQAPLRGSSGAADACWLGSR
ncbi:hypothetical protein [Pseudonocardia pini]|uniref:hypothetical protein n=1 Tax=Pseudonocardia pini TaxID=2758030 RepID=UPI0015F03614|nr:hypothetical protein [Pseudonocardia pini]